MNAMLLATLCVIGQANEYAQTFHHDFRSGPLPDELVRNPGYYPMDFEKDGLRIKLPKDRKNMGQVGIITNFPIKGDFEITAAYEILHADQPTDGWGVGATMFVMCGEDTGKDAVGIYRLNRAKGVQTIHWNCVVIRDGQRDYKDGRIACDAKLFRLRMTRSKKTVTCFWAPGLSGGEFHEIGSTAFISDDVRSVTLNTTTGNKRYDLDARFVDLRIRSSVKSMSEPEQGPSVGERMQKRWRLMLVALLFGVAMSAGMLAWWLRRRRQNAENPKS